MPVLYACSFEGGSTPFYQNSGWTMTTTTVVSTLRRHLTPQGVGGSYTCDSPGGTLTSPGFAVGSARWVHFAMQSRGAVGVINLGFLRSAGNTFFVRINGGGTIDLLRGAGNIAGATVVATSVLTVNMATMHWFAVQYTGLAAGGLCEVWVDGVLMVTFSGNTRGHATLDNWDQFQWNGVNGAGSNDITIDDVIITNAAGGRVAEQFCQVMVPNAVVSGNLTGVPVTGSSRWQNIDEIPVSQADYNEAAAISDEDLYEFSNPATPVSVLCAVAWVEASRSGTITMVAPSVKVGATQVYATPTVLPTTGFAAVPYIRETDPATSLAWTGAGLNALQAGARFT